MNNKLIISAIINGLIWSFTYLYIRRYFNPENNKNIEKWKTDAIYGGIASAISVILKDVITKKII
jgi:hypothetical protein